VNEKKPEKQIDYVELPTTDLSATKFFYGTVFGWKFEDYGPGYTSFFDGRIGGGFTTEMQAPAKGALLVIYAHDLSATQASVISAGGRIVRETFSFPGGRRFHFMDPDGNELAVWSDVSS
jgi:predicted enzyme related to lactoylglutathione lyase